MRRLLPLVAILLLLAALLPASPASAAGPNGAATEAAYRAKVLAYWTPERMRAAIPRDLVLDPVRGVVVTIPARAVERVALPAVDSFLAERERRTSLGKWWGGAVAAWREVHGAHPVDVVRGGKRARVVEFDHRRRAAKIVDLADQAGAHHRRAVFQIDERIIDGAVIGAVEGKDFRAPADPAAPADRGTRSAGRTCRSGARHG